MASSDDDNADENQVIEQEHNVVNIPMQGIQSLLDDPGNPVLLSPDFLDSLRFLDDAESPMYQFLSELQVIDLLGQVVTTDSILQDGQSNDRSDEYLPLYI